MTSHHRFVQFRVHWIAFHVWNLAHLHNRVKTYRLIIAFPFRSRFSLTWFHPMRGGYANPSRIRHVIISIFAKRHDSRRAVIHGALCWCYFDVISCLIKFPRPRPGRCNNRRSTEANGKAACDGKACVSINHIIISHLKIFQIFTLIKASRVVAPRIGRWNINFHFACAPTPTLALCEPNR